MSYIKLDINGVVIYKTQYPEIGTISVPDWVSCGYIQSGLTYIAPTPHPNVAILRNIEILEIQLSRRLLGEAFATPNLVNPVTARNAQQQIAFLNTALVAARASLT